MTRINVIDVELLLDKHLLAEHRELTRIPNTVVSGKAKLDGKYSKHYTLGAGHVKVFYNKLGWLRRRYDELHKECLSRGFNVSYKFPESVPERLCGELEVRVEDVQVNVQRILDRFPQGGKLRGKAMSVEEYRRILC